jgi:hypothetical protein
MGVIYMKHTMNKPMIEKSLLSLIIFIFISLNAYSVYPDVYTYSTCGYYDCYGNYSYSTCGYCYGCYGLYGGTCLTCGSPYDFSCEPNPPYTMTYKTCLNNGCTKEVCMTDLFQNPLSYFYEYPYGLYPPYLLKPIIVETGEKIETMETCEPCIPNIFMMWSEPSAPPAF